MGCFMIILVAEMMVTMICMVYHDNRLADNNVGGDEGSNTAL
jgi:hypothetical protein